MVIVMFHNTRVISYKNQFITNLETLVVATKVNRILDSKKSKIINDTIQIDLLIHKIVVLIILRLFVFSNHFMFHTVTNVLHKIRTINNRIDTIKDLKHTEINAYYFFIIGNLILQYPDNGIPYMVKRTYIIYIGKILYVFINFKVIYVVNILNHIYVIN